MTEENIGRIETKILVVALSFFFLLSLSPAVFSVPTGPSSITNVANETKATTAGQLVNISGGYIATINLTADVQNTRWKAFVGWINGVFTLDDSSGSTIYDWSLTSITGEVYATRYSGSITWSGVGCANMANITYEDTQLWHTGEDSINLTFNPASNAGTFLVAGNTITASSCYALNTYVNNVSASDFEEVILTDTTNHTIFATILEQDATGFDGNTYDFQMIVPENGSALWAGIVPYYLYVELS